MAEQLRSASLLVRTALADDQTLQDLKNDPKATLKKLESATVQQLPRALPIPEGTALNGIWYTIVIAFAAVMVFAVVILGVNVWTKLETGATYATRSDTMLTVFTTVVGFLAGLLSPSPISKKE
jgi:hypothetical protein